MTKRILILIPSMAGAGGTERMVHSLSKLLSDAGAQVHQASFDAPQTKRHFEGATPIHGLGPFPRLPFPLRPVYYWMAASRLRRLKRSIGTDLTISNLWGADLISVLSGGRDYKVALCHINVIGNPTNSLMVRLRPLVAAVYHRFQQVIAVNEALATELTSLYRLHSRPVSHIDNFVDTPHTDSVLPSDGVTRFVWCGRFASEKNVEGLLFAWARFAQSRAGVQLVLVGEGPLREEMRNLALSLGLGWETDPDMRDARLVSVGKVSDPAAYMAGARALLLTSRAEGLPMVMLEAMALGIPVLAADCHAGGVRTAMVGSGTCNPARHSAELGPAGALLPVPTVDVPETLRLWAEALDESFNEFRWDQWRSGALGRAKLFDSTSALRKWNRALELQESSV